MTSKKRSGLVLVFLASALTMAFVCPHSSAQATGLLSGVVTDLNEARVSGATVTVEGGGTIRSVTTNEDGTYQIDLPAGLYRIKVDNRGFCPTRRAALRIQPSVKTNICFVLIVCPTIHDLKITNDQYVGEAVRQDDPYREESFPLAHSSGAPLELFVRYLQRRVDRTFIEYRGATVTYDALTIRADLVRFESKAFRIEAQGKAIVQDGKQTVQAKRVTADLRRGELKVELDF